MSKGDCRSCDADVFWAQTFSGRPILLNSGVNMEKGNVRVLAPLAHSGNERVLVVEVLRKSEIGVPSLDPAERRYVAHFVTCPASKQWSGKHR